MCRVRVGYDSVQEILLKCVLIDLFAFNATGLIVIVCQHDL